MITGQQDIRELNRSNLPKWYRWQIHIFANALIFGITLILGFRQLSVINLKSLVLLSLYILVWGIIEYAIHRFVLHGPILQNLNFKREHTYFHHGCFTANSNSAQSWFDVNRILLRPMDIFAVIVLNLILSFMLSLIIPGDFSILFFNAGVLYLIIYEVIHGLCHTNLNFPVVNALKRHHKDHHEVLAMDEKNFAVVFPFLDKFFGSQTGIGSNDV